MIDQEIFEDLLPRAYEWAQTQEELILARGVPLGPQQIADARLAGVQDCDRIRILVVDRIPLPQDPELAAATRVVQIITDKTRCVGFGHAIIIRADAWGDRELLAHNLVHIAQCERSGGLETWVREYLLDRRHCPKFTVGPLEDEARRVAKEICCGKSTANAA